METLYQQKVQILKNVAAHVDNGRMPILDFSQSWPIAYAGRTMQECIDDGDEEIKIYGKHLEDIYFDGCLNFGMNRPMKCYQGMGYAPFFPSPDGVTLQTDDSSKILMDDEIDRFIEDPTKFLREVAIARRYPSLQKEYPEDRKALASSIMGLVDFIGRSAKRQKALEEVYQTPMILNSTSIQPPLDIYLLYRGFVKGMGDLYRRPKQVQAAAEAIMPWYMPPAPKMPDFPWVFSTFLTPDYLNPRQYEKFLWPTYKKLAEAYSAAGCPLLVPYEGRWDKKCELFAELPKGTFVVYLQCSEEQFFEAQAKIGDKVALIYPFPLEMLKNGTKEEVVKHAKEVIDRAGTTGVIMGTSHVLNSPKDVNHENLKALSDVCLNYRP